MNVVTKELTATATIEPVENDTSEWGEADVILSTSAVDRDGEEVLPEEWELPLPDYITFDNDHGMSVDTTVGGGEPYINEKGQLRVRVGFSQIPRAQETRTLVNERIIRSVSVAFLRKKDEKTGKISRELLNGSFVPVGCNKEAVILSSKSADQKVTPADLAAAAVKKQTSDWRDDTLAAVAAMFEQGVPDQKYLQGVHDFAVKLGAGCPYSDPSATPGVLAPSNRSVDESAVSTKSSPTEIEEATPTDAPEQAVVAETDDSDDVATGVTKALLKLRAHS